jgi:hypothetical protein
MKRLIVIDEEELKRKKIKESLKVENKAWKALIQPWLVEAKR